MKSVETVAVGLYADCGSRNEPPYINGIAHVLALAGYDVVLDDINKDALSKAIGLIEKNMQRQAHKGIIKEEQIKPALGRISSSPPI